MKRKCLFDVGFYYGGPYERGTCCVGVEQIGLFLANSEAEAEKLAIGARGCSLPSGYEFKTLKIRRSDKVAAKMFAELNAEIHTLTMKRNTVTKWAGILDEK